LQNRTFIVLLSTMENGSFSLDVACSQSTDREDNTQDTVAVVQPSAGASITAAENFYTEKSQSLKALVVMCRGLLDVDDQPLFDIAVEPWCSVKAAVVKPNSREYKEEIERRLAISASYSGNNYPRGNLVRSSGRCRRCSSGWIIILSPTKRMSRS
jgi:hypothetical protein